MKGGFWEKALALAIAILAALCVYCLTRPKVPEIAPEPAAPVEETIVVTGDEPSPIEISEDSELYHLEAIEFYPVPIDHDLQAHIIRTSDTYDVDAVIVFAVILKESNFDAAAIGDNSESVGLMQVQEKWHSGRMAKLGATDLTDPYQNVTVGIDFLAELLDRYTLEDALTAYNSGSPGESEYSEEVIKNMEVLKNA